MGICKCRKRTDLYCFAHKKAVCADCVVECDGELAHIASYVSWLENATAPEPTCALSGQRLSAATPHVRLSNMRLYAIAALNELAASLPPRSPIAAYTLPTGEAIIPPMADTSRLAERIRSELRRCTWAAPLIALQEELAAPVVAAPILSASPAASPLKRSAHADHVVVALSSSGSGAPAPSVAPAPSTAPSARGRFAVLTTRRLLLLAALLSTLVVVLFLSLSLDAEELETVQRPFARGGSNLPPLMPVPAEARV